MKTSQQKEKINTWQGSFEYNEDMKLRYQNMLKLLPPNYSYSSVLDLGCGPQYLKEFIDKNSTYTGVDLYPHNKDNIICDFNKNQFVDINADLVVIAGVFEYVYDTEWFIKKVCKTSNKYVLCSYIFKEYTNSFCDLWVNSHTQKELFDIFFQQGFKLAGYCLDPIHPIPNSTGYFCFEKNRNY